MNCSGVSYTTAPTRLKLEPTVPGGRGPGGWRQCPAGSEGAWAVLAPGSRAAPAQGGGSTAALHPRARTSVSFPAIHLAYRPDFPQSSGTAGAVPLLRNEYVSTTDARFLMGCFSQRKTAPREVSRWKETSTAVTALSQKCPCSGCLAHENCWDHVPHFSFLFQK